MPPKVLEAVTIFQSHVVENAMLADGTVDAESVSRTRKGKKELGVLLGFDNAYARQREKKRTRKKNRSGAASSARAATQDDDQESDQ